MSESKEDVVDLGHVVDMAFGGVSMLGGGVGRHDGIITDDVPGIDFEALKGRIAVLVIDAVEVIPQHAPKSETRVGVGLFFEGSALLETAVPPMSNGILVSESAPVVDRAWWPPSGAIRAILANVFGFNRVQTSRVMNATDLTELKFLRTTETTVVDGKVAPIAEDEADIMARMADHLTRRLRGWVAVVRDTGLRTSRKNDDRQVRDQQFYIMPPDKLTFAVQMGDTVQSVSFEDLMRGRSTGAGLLRVLQFTAASRGWIAMPPRDALPAPSAAAALDVEDDDAFDGPF